VGLRLNQLPPQIYIKTKHQGGCQVNITVPGGLTKMSESTVLKILQEYKIHHAELILREDCSVDQLIDALEGNRKYVRCMYVYNKVGPPRHSPPHELSLRVNRHPMTWRLLYKARLNCKSNDQ